MKVIGLLLSLMGAVTIYCSQRQLNLLSRMTALFFKVLGTAILIAGLCILLSSLPKMVAGFTWAMLIILVWAFFPLFSLFSPKFE